VAIKLRFFRESLGIAKVTNFSDEHSFRESLGIVLEFQYGPAFET